MMSRKLTTQKLAELRKKLGGYSFTVEPDPDYSDFFSVFATKDGTGAEIAGKIGDKTVATAIAIMFVQLLN